MLMIMMMMIIIIVIIVIITCMYVFILFDLLSIMIKLVENCGLHFWHFLVIVDKSQSIAWQSNCWICEYVHCIYDTCST